MEEQHVDEIAGHVPDDHIGIRLKHQRLELGRELADIAHQTRIPLRHLTAIEEGNHDALPALPYTVGFVKSYARSIGLDAQECADRFRAETTKADRVTPSMIHEPIGDARVPSRGAALVGVALLAIVVLVIVGYSAGWFGGGARPAPEVADVTTSETAPVGAGDAMLSTPEPAAAPAPAAPQDAAPGLGQPTAVLPPPAAGAHAIVIAAREDAWVKVYPVGGGDALVMGVMAAGDRFQVPAGREDLLLWTGRAGALDITVDGQPVPALGAPTETVKDVPLTAQGLAGRSAKQPG